MLASCRAQTLEMGEEAGAADARLAESARHFRQSTLQAQA